MTPICQFDRDWSETHGVIALLAMMAAQTGPDIVVDGRRVSSASIGCGRRTCTVAQDAAAAIALADAAFRVGDYRRAGEGLEAAIGRNRGHVRDDPRAVASLYEALATVSLHDGDREAYQSNTARRASALRDHLPIDDPAVTEAEMALGDMWVTMGNFGDADVTYRLAQGRVAASGNLRLSGMLGLRRIWLAAVRRDDTRAARLLRDLESGLEGGDPVVRDAISVVRLRMAALRGDAREVDRFIASIAPRSTLVRALIWSPPYDLPFGTEGEWADIGFWIMPGGRTRDAAVLRGSLARGWTTAVARQIGQRRYTADLSASDVYRIEHYSVRGTYIVPTGSRIRQKLGEVGIESVELTGRSGKPMVER